MQGGDEVEQAVADDHGDDAHDAVLETNMEKRPIHAHARKTKVLADTNNITLSFKRSELSYILFNYGTKMAAICGIVSTFAAKNDNDIR